MRRCVSIALAAFSLAGAATPASANDQFSRPNLVGFGVTAGTMGIGGEVSALVYDTLVLRMNASTLTIDLRDTFSDGGTGTDNFNFNFKGLFAGAILDWHPFRTGWRLSAGAGYMDLEFTDTDTTGKTLGGTPYTAEQVGVIRTTVTNSSSIAPYIGLGYDASHFTRDGLGFSLGIDIGVLLGGDPNVKITTDKSVPGLVAAIAAESETVKGDIKGWYNYYPVLMVSGKFSF